MTKTNFLRQYNINAYYWQLYKDLPKFYQYIKKDKGKVKISSPSRLAKHFERIINEKKKAS